MSAPTLSIVLTGRHDNYGGDFNERLFASLRFNHARLAERHVALEIVFVEWNPLPDKPLLAEVLAREFPDLPLRCIVVAREYQAALTQNPQIRYLEYLAKNVGIRRAAGTFILATNTDVLLGRHVVDVIASGTLTAGTVYRAARYDLKEDTDKTRLTWDSLEDPSGHARRPRLKPPLLTGGTGDFLLADRATFHALRGFNEVYRAARAGVDVNFLVKANGGGYPIVDIGGPVYHINHEGSFRLSKAAYKEAPTDTPWGNLRWHSRHVAYSNPDGWGLGDAPVRPLGGGGLFVNFDWRVVPPLVELRRIVLPVRSVRL